MSLKQKKHSEIKKLEEKMKSKPSKMDTLIELPPYTLIVSEGIKTEPLYLNGFVKKINEKYRKFSKEPHIVVHGTGQNTKGLIRYVDKRLISGEWTHFRKIWLVYDKDDFPLDNFDNTQFEAEARQNPKMSVAWSNESIELWFLLHFQEYLSNNGRKQYKEKINKYFDYSKTREDLYDVIMAKGSVSDAKRRARKMYKEFIDKGESSMSSMVPATRMYELVEELEKYIDE